MFSHTPFRTKQLHRSLTNRYNYTFLKSVNEACFKTFAHLNTKTIPVPTETRKFSVGYFFFLVMPFKKVNY